MKKRTCRLLSVLLALCLALALLPGTALAAEGTTVYAGTVEELKDALKSNTTIILEGKDYTVDSFFYLSNLENVTIQGTTGTRIISTSATSLVIQVWVCKNVVLDNLVLGHDPAASEQGCTQGVLFVTNSEMTVSNCDIFGCGICGIQARSSTITVEKSTIRDCSEYILGLTGGNMTFNN